jgi:sugar lactone lactonase YvrE
MIVMTGATTFFINFINTQVKGVSYLNIINENMRDMQFLVRKIKQSSVVKKLVSPLFVDSENWEHLLLRNTDPNLGPYSLITTKEVANQDYPDANKKILAIKDFFVFNDLVFDFENQYLYYADTGNHVVRRVVFPNLSIEIVAGVFGKPGFNEDFEPLAINSRLNNPMGLALDPAGGILIADTGNHRLRKVNPEGVMTTIAGTGSPGFNESEANRDPLANNLNAPTDIEVAADHTIYFADSGNHRIRKITNDQKIITIAGTGNYGFTGNVEKALEADLNTPVGITVDENNQNLYFTDTYNSRIAKIDLATGSLKNVAGAKFRTYAGDNGLAVYAKLNLPAGVRYVNNSLLVTDSLNHVVREISSGSDDILGTEDDLIRLKAGYNGQVFINPGADLFDDQDDQYLSTVDPVPGFLEGENEEGAPAVSSLVLFNNPSGIVVDEKGNIYLSDSLNNRIRVIISQDSAVNFELPERQLQSGFVYTLIKNQEVGAEAVTLFRNIDYANFVFDGINDYLGKNNVQTLQFTVPELLDQINQTYVVINMVLKGVDDRDDSEVSSKLNTTVVVREYRK